MRTASAPAQFALKMARHCWPCVRPPVRILSARKPSRLPAFPPGHSRLAYGLALCLDGWVKFRLPVRSLASVWPTFRKPSCGSWQYCRPTRVWVSGESCSPAPRRWSGRRGIQPRGSGHPPTVARAPTASTWPQAGARRLSAKDGSTCVRPGWNVDQLPRNWPATIQATGG